MKAEYRKILVATDGSDEAELAINAAIELAKENDAHLDVLNIIDTIAMTSYSVPITGDLVYELTLKAQEYMDEIEERAKAKGLDKINVHVRFGKPRVVISKEFPKEYDNDLIVMGATGLNAMERLLIGSVSEFVSRNAPCDVLIVRTGLKK
jgi:nucleotide-binding universal stress UspA family protein